MSHPIKLRTITKWLAACLTLGLILSLATPAQAAVDNGRWLHTRGSQILDAQNRVVQLKAINWFGMETEACAPFGLDVTTPRDLLRRAHRLGFNTLRLPWSSACLHGGVPRWINTDVNPDLTGLDYQALMDRVVAVAGEEHIRVILDHHRTLATRQTPLWYYGAYTREMFTEDWVQLARHYGSNSNVVGFDLHNEPHQSCWDCGDAVQDWRLAAQQTGNAVLRASPNLLIIVEGTGREASSRIDDGYAFWGGGLSHARHAPVKLLVPHRLVYSTHEYGPSQLAMAGQPPLKRFRSGKLSQVLPRTWNASFGYLVHQHIAPVLVGELGFTAHTRADRTWAQEMTRYIHRNRLSYGYWALNANALLPVNYGLLAPDWQHWRPYQLARVRQLLDQPA